MTLTSSKTSVTMAPNAIVQDDKSFTRTTDLLLGTSSPHTSAPIPIVSFHNLMRANQDADHKIIRWLLLESKDLERLLCLRLFLVYLCTNPGCRPPSFLSIAILPVRRGQARRSELESDRERSMVRIETYSIICSDLRSGLKEILQL